MASVYGRAAPEAGALFHPGLFRVVSERYVFDSFLLKPRFISEYPDRRLNPGRRAASTEPGGIES